MKFPHHFITYCYVCETLRNTYVRNSHNPIPISQPFSRKTVSKQKNSHREIQRISIGCNFLSQWLFYVLFIKEMGKIPSPPASQSKETYTASQRRRIINSKANTMTCTKYTFFNKWTLIMYHTKGGKTKYMLVPKQSP